MAQPAAANKPAATPQRAAPAPRSNASAATRPSAPPPKAAREPQAREAPAAPVTPAVAAQHLWELVRAKKQRARQKPSWQQIPHHDHPAPPSAPAVAELEPEDPAGQRMPHGSYGGGDHGGGDRDKG